MGSIPCGGQQKVSLIVSPSLTYSLGQVLIATTYSPCLTTFKAATMTFSWQRRIRKYTALFLLLVLDCSAFSFWPFPPKRFKGNSLLEAGSLGLGEDQRVLAFGDFNGDQL